MAWKRQAQECALLERDGAASFPIQTHCRQVTQLGSMADTQKTCLAGIRMQELEQRSGAISRAQERGFFERPGEM